MFARVSLAPSALIAALIAALALPAAAGDYVRRDDGNAAYNAYNSRDGYARRGYWDRPGEGRWRHRHRHHHGCGHRGWGGGDYDQGYGRDDLAYYPGHGYAQVVVEPGHGGGGRADWCARRYRSYDYRTGTYVGYDGYRRRCG